MRFGCFVTVITFLSSFHLYSQELPGNKQLNHTVSIQVNELIRQIIDLDADDNDINNPFLINYSMIHTKSKFGITAGFGYDYSKTSDKDSPGSQESELNDYNGRIGVGRMFPLGKKLNLISSLDFVMQYKVNNTVASSVVETPNFVDSTINVSTSIDEGYGGGLQLRLGWDITKTISLSTEATFYFMKFSEKDNTMVAQYTENIDFPENNLYTISSSNSNISHTKFNMLVPVAIFLGVKF